MMRGMFFLGEKRFERREMDLGAPAAGEVLVRVKACGVCGTDVHIFMGEKGSADVTPPVVLGHEFSGVVEAAGEGVASLAVGDHVTVDPNIYCGKCHFCRIGKKHMCERMQAIGVTRDGGFAEYCLCPEAQCFKLGPSVPFSHGALAEPLACCLHGIDRADIRPGDTVCVVGGGAIGLIMAQLAKLAGTSFVMLSEPVEMRRTIGLRVGADVAVDPLHENLPAMLKKHTGTGGADVVIECAGSLPAAKQAVEAAKPGATVLLFSVPKPDAALSLPLMDVFKKELTIRGSFINPDTHQRAVELINRGRLKFDPILTHSFPLERLEDAILAQVGSDSLKVIVTP